VFVSAKNTGVGVGIFWRIVPPAEFAGVIIGLLLAYLKIKMRQQHTFSA